MFQVGSVVGVVGSKRARMASSLDHRDIVGGAVGADGNPAGVIGGNVIKQERTGVEGVDTVNYDNAAAALHSATTGFATGQPQVKNIKYK